MPCQSLVGRSQHQGSTLRGALLHWAEGQVNISVPALYMAGKILSCNFRDTITRGKSNILSTKQILKAIAGKQLSGTLYWSPP